MTTHVKKILGRAFKVCLLSGLTALLFSAADMTFAASSGVTIANLQSNLADTVTAVGKILVDVSLICGIGFILVSFFKFHAHKNNPQQISLSQGITLLVIGAGLTVFPYLIKGVAGAATGSSKTGSVTGSSMAGIMGGSGSK